MLYENIIPDYLFGDVDSLIIGNKKVKCSNLLIYSRFNLAKKSDISNAIFSKLNNDLVEGDLVQFNDSFYGKYSKKIGSDKLSTSLLNSEDDLYVSLANRDPFILSYLENMLDSLGFDDLDNKSKVLIENYIVPFETDLDSFNEDRIREIKEKPTKISGLDDLWQVYVTLNNFNLPSLNSLKPAEILVVGDFVNYSSVSHSLDILYSQINLESMKTKEELNKRTLDSSASLVIDTLNKDYINGKINPYKSLEIVNSSKVLN